MLRISRLLCKFNFRIICHLYIYIRFFNFFLYILGKTQPNLQYCQISNQLIKNGAIASIQNRFESTQVQPCRFNLINPNQL